MQSTGFGRKGESNQGTLTCLPSATQRKGGRGSQAPPIEALAGVPVALRGKGAKFPEHSAL